MNDSTESILFVIHLFQHTYYVTYRTCDACQATTRIHLTRFWINVSVFSITLATCSCSTLAFELIKT